MHEKCSSLSCSTVLPPAYPVFYLHIYTHVNVHTREYYVSVNARMYVNLYIQLRVASLTAISDTRLPTRNRNEEEEAKLHSPDDLSLSVDYHRACAYASTNTQERTTRVLLILLESCTTRRLTIVSTSHCIARPSTESIHRMIKEQDYWSLNPSFENPRRYIISLPLS